MLRRICRRVKLSFRVGAGPDLQQPLSVAESCSPSFRLNPQPRATLLNNGGMHSNWFITLVSVLLLPFYWKRKAPHSHVDSIKWSCHKRSFSPPQGYSPPWYHFQEAGHHFLLCPLNSSRFNLNRITVVYWFQCIRVLLSRYVTGKRRKYKI